MPPEPEKCLESLPQQQSGLTSVSSIEQAPHSKGPKSSSPVSTPDSRRAREESEDEEKESDEQEEKEEEASDIYEDESVLGLGDLYNRPPAASAWDDAHAGGERWRLDDTTTLTPAQTLEQHKKRVKLCTENESYLRRHHELGDMLELFVNRALREQPENILKFAGNFFTQPHLREVVEDYSKRTVVRPDNRFTDKFYGV